MPTRLSKIDELTRPDHTFLDPDDHCYYLGEYTARAGYAFSSMNDLIQNLKKPMDRRGRPEWKYKTLAISRSCEMLREVVPEKWLARATFVPVPPSKTRTTTIMTTGPSKSYRSWVRGGCSTFASSSS